MREQFSYSLMASGLGILIVFSILVLLSLVMIIIKKLSDPDTSKKKKPEPAPAQKKAAAGAAPTLPLPVLVAAATAGESGNASWLIAAVAAFLAAEDDDTVAPRAASWISTPGKYDPWVANNKLSKTVPGV